MLPQSLAVVLLFAYEINQIYALALTSLIPNYTDCPQGRRFVVGYIMYLCTVNEEKKQRSFKPFACATENNVNATLIKPSTTWNDLHFRYKCEKEDNKLTLKPLTCLLSDVHVTAGTTIRRAETEYKCVLDNEVYMKLIQKRMLHDFCMPGNQNDSLLENDQCPGLSISAIHAKYGSGTAVTFDEKTIVEDDNSSAATTTR